MTQEPKPGSAEFERLYDEYVASGAHTSWQQWLLGRADSLPGGPAAPASLEDAARAALPALVLLGDFIGNTFEGKTGIPAFDRCRIILDLKRALGELPDGTAG